MSEGGEIYLLDMGKPVKIMELAIQMIKKSGLVLKDEKNKKGNIEIISTGLRPGEKLYEELQLRNEQKVSTSHMKIMILKDRNSMIPWTIFKTSIDELCTAAENLDSEKIQILLKQILPTYTTSNFGLSLENRTSLPISRIKAEA